MTEPTSTTETKPEDLTSELTGLAGSVATSVSDLEARARDAAYQALAVRQTGLHHAGEMVKSWVDAGATDVDSAVDKLLKVADKITAWLHNGSTGSSTPTA